MRRIVLVALAGLVLGACQPYRDRGPYYGGHPGYRGGWWGDPEPTDSWGRPRPPDRAAPYGWTLERRRGPDGRLYDRWEQAPAPRSEQ